MRSTGRCSPASSGTIRRSVSSTLLKGKFALRLCIINHTTTWNDVRETLETVERFGWEELDKG